MYIGFINMTLWLGNLVLSFLDKIQFVWIRIPNSDTDWINPLESRINVFLLYLEGKDFKFRYLPDKLWSHLNYAFSQWKPKIEMKIFNKLNKIHSFYVKDWNTVWQSRYGWDFPNITKTPLSVPKPKPLGIFSVREFVYFFCFGSNFLGFSSSRSQK